MAEASDTSERGLEGLICTALAGHPCEPPKDGKIAEARPGYGGVGWSGGNSGDYDREFCVDRVQLGAFLHGTQPETADALGLGEDGPTRRRFLARLQGEIAKRGTIDVLRHGVRHGAHHLELSTARRRPGTRRRRNGSRRTASPSSGSSGTAVTRRSGRSTSACSSTACRSSPSS